jgi:iron-sulfur cluster repair protein YtfE (RIC family)
MISNAPATRGDIVSPVLPDPPLADRLIRDLVETYPETMTVLAPLGLDLCCGGGHPLGEALDLHGLDRETVLPRVARVIAGPGPEGE